MIRTLARITLGVLFAAEGGLALRRFEAREKAFAAASARAQATGRPLIVVGDPDAGAHTKIVRAYGCGDLCVDLNGCPRCPAMQAVDLTTGRVDVPDDSAVVFVSCVLEYVSDPPAALAELRRIAGAPDNLFIVWVDPNSLTATLFPHAKWAVADAEAMTMTPVTGTRKVAVAGAVLGLGLLATLPE